MKRIKEIYIDENKRDIEATRGDKGVCDRNWKHKIYEVVEGIKINGQRFKGSMQSQMVSSKIKAKSRPKVASKSKTKLGKQLVPKNLQIEKNKELGGGGSIEEHSKTDSNSGRGEAKRVETQELDMGRELREKLETIKREMGSRWLQVYIKPRDGDGKDTISEGEGGCSGEGLETKIPEYIFPELANRRVYQGYEELMSTPKNEGSEVREGEEQKTDPGIEMEELEECNASTTVEVDVEQRVDSQNEEIEKKTKYSVTEYYLVDLISESRKKEIGQIELSSSATVEYNDGFIRLYEEYEGDKGVLF
ncbi:hypothetical protein AX774_g5586 [Zancudomyces culisetae]|uniref:Uncharacterized protein n=1 Tax=Zancudomyces culisetae TaxID=1213189 RepID=A0A1R1PJB4_ZANCU|nr:hypothetical protein AX774_g5586 [Zancudomyces culisetae]|eukprot:OMH80962.1 hypothetical protein AX774_g5586 [Zancudomyces culisetae]